jgi:hypothetical protein
MPAQPTEDVNPEQNLDVLATRGALSHQAPRPLSKPRMDLAPLVGYSWCQRIWALAVSAARRLMRDMLSASGHRVAGGCTVGAWPHRSRPVGELGVEPGHGGLVNAYAAVLNLHRDPRPPRSSITSLRGFGIGHLSEIWRGGFASHFQETGGQRPDSENARGSANG